MFPDLPCKNASGVVHLCLIVWLPYTPPSPSLSPTITKTKEQLPKQLLRTLTDIDPLGTMQLQKYAMECHVMQCDVM